MLQSPAIYAAESALDLLGLFDRELNATIDDNGWRQGYGITVVVPVMIQFESLQTELKTDGREITLERVVGSKREFEDLCEFVCDQIGVSTD